MKTTRETVAELMAKGAEAADTDPVETQGASTEETTDTGLAAEPVETAADADDKPAVESKGPTRGPDGKFIRPDAKPASTEGTPVVATAAKPAEGTAAADALPALKPPANWTPKAKEKWAGLPREVQEEAHRLHLEVSKTLQETAGARQAADAFQRTVAPYEHMFRAAGKSPIEGVGWLVQQYAALQTAPMSQRAQIVAGLVRDFIGVDEASINLLASALEGKPGAGPAAHAPLRPEQIQQLVREEAQRMQGEGRRQAETKAIQDFEASAPEFLPNLLKEITAIVAIAQREGKPITVELLKEAHAQALRINPETAAILKQRDAAAAAAKAKADAAKNAAAASGIRNEPAGPTGQAAGEKNTRDTVARLMKQPRGGARV